MSINYTAVLVASIADFAIGAIWYMPIFGNLWGKIHGFAKMSKKEQAEARKGMAPLMVTQFIITLLTALVLAKFIILLPDYSAYTLAAMVWVGFVVPAQIASVIFGGTDKKWFVTKTAIMAGGSLACLLAAAAILKAF